VPTAGAVGIQIVEHNAVELEQLARLAAEAVPALDPLHADPGTAAGQRFR
jgi:hypothetical protein